MASANNSTRQTLSNITNIPRRVTIPDRKRTRRQTEEHDALLDASSLPCPPPPSLKPQTVHTAQDNASVKARTRVGTLRQIRQAGLCLSRPVTAPVSSRPILESFVSSKTTDRHVFRNEHGHISPLVSCSYSNSTKRGKESILAVTTDDGAVELVNTARCKEELAPTPVHIQATATGAIFDVQWRGDDKHIALACDASLCIFDVETQTALSQFSGHTAAIKTIAWDPTDHALLTTAGRDGNINVWDTRLHSGAYDLRVAPALVIKQAHNPESRRKRNVPHSTSKSVTSILYSPNSPRHLVSSGSADGILLKWDLRSVRSAKQSVEETYSDPTTAYTESKRPRGITSIVYGGPGDGLIYGLGTDAMVYPYLTSTLVAHPGVFSSAPSGGGGSGLSFFCRLSTSPCGRWLGTGGDGGCASLFDISGQSDVVVDRRPVVLRTESSRPSSEVTAISWGTPDTVALCSDEVVTIWRANADQARACREDREKNSWHWRWIE